MVVQGAVIEKLLAVEEGEDFEHHSEPDVNITFTEECDE